MKMCPILLMNRSLDNKASICLEEKCAWFDVNFEECSILSIAQKLTKIDEQLIKLNKPQEHVGGP